jgi:hypothetical protein
LRIRFKLPHFLPPLVSLNAPCFFYLSTKMIARTQAFTICAYVSILRIVSGAKARQIKTIFGLHIGDFVDYNHTCSAILKDSCVLNI